MPPPGAGSPGVPGGPVDPGGPDGPGGPNENGNLSFDISGIPPGLALGLNHMPPPKDGTGVGLLRLESHFCTCPQMPSCNALLPPRADTKDSTCFLKFAISSCCISRAARCSSMVFCSMVTSLVSERSRPAWRLEVTCSKATLSLSRVSVLAARRHAWRATRICSRGGEKYAIARYQE